MLRTDRTPFMVPASYSRSPFRDLIGNPLAEALPHLPATPKATFQALRRSIEFDEVERNDSDSTRLFAINRVDTLFEPLAPHYANFQDIYFHILNGYRHRPIQDAAFQRAIVASYRNAMRGGVRDISRTHP
ncbi:MAG: hypothetical protein KDJ17_04660, partial [Hyphomicrobiaceae bacterium]|nr:hypothetical protein [Hyphomicrobiaceae bacterium]